MSADRLERVAFTTSRLAEFCSQSELVAQTGAEVSNWPLVIVKELIDNGLDACEEVGTAPMIEVSVSTEPGEIVVGDNGHGLSEETIAGILDYSSRTSSKEAYVRPSRGQQGNAMQCILAMPYA